jgi:outer membrane autotransporter protein
VSNYGDLGAMAVTLAGYSSATAAMVIGQRGGTVYNAGDIASVATAGDGSAYATGLNVLSPGGDITITNSGTISAAAVGDSGTAIGVSMVSSGYNTLVNDGSIIATGTGSQHIAVVSSDAAYASISNTGSISGSILTGQRDDTLVNQAEGSIVLRNDLIDLGMYSSLGNSFINDGLIVVRGAGNGIDMGQGLATIVPSLNPQAFTNYGTIDFQDGAADDLLTVTGDFAGEGQINVDVSGLHGSSDQLYIDGSVVSGTVQTINIDLLDLPTTASSQIDIVSVSGNSSAGNFVLGDVDFGFSPGFLALDVSLHSHLDASNANNDVFSLGVDVTGLSDAGSLATAIAPGAQSLMQTQVGTWRQRNGVIEQAAKHGVSLWARLFQAKGSISPEHSADNFGQGGNFAFDQKNSGVEVGADIAFTEQLSAGVLLAKAEGSQHLAAAGTGSSQIKGDTVGVYGTWISPNGFYVDGSYRWMNFTARLAAAQADGQAGTLNLEAGYAWTLDGGLVLEPQAQFTHTRVSDVDSLSLGATELQVANGDSSTGRLGVLARKSFGAAGGTVWTPYASLSAVHEFDGDNGYTINGAFSGAGSTGGSSALVEAGVTARTGNVSVAGGLNWQDGGAFNSFLGGQLSVRFTW